MPPNDNLVCSRAHLDENDLNGFSITLQIFINSISVISEILLDKINDIYSSLKAFLL